MELYAGLDLHSRNTYIGIMDKEFKRVFGKRVSNKLPLILKTLDPFQDQLEGIVVESTFNWYWLIDGLMDAGYHCVHLANPAAMDYTSHCTSFILFDRGLLLPCFFLLDS
jgi:hypothetical protein